MTMTATIHTFTRVLQTPDLSLRTLGEARPVLDANGLPRLMRTTRFAEAEILWQGHRWLLALPLSPAALFSLERTLQQMARCSSPWLPECRLLRSEMRWCGPTGESRSCDLLLQLLPEGRSLEEAMGCEGGERLAEALDALQCELRRLHLSHGNLRRDNLRWTGQRFVPIRFYDAAPGCPERDEEAFAALRQEVLQASGMPGVSDVEAGYEVPCRWPGHCWVSNLFEGLVCVEDETGYGYVDAGNRPVIASQYLWAGDFHEGRAEVQTAEGMGLIDRQGRYVIPPEYEIVSYIPAESIALVRQNGRWAQFDYLGKRISPFVEDGQLLGVTELT